jgi:hypothetical protein
LRNANVHAFVRHYLHESGNANARLASGELIDLQSARNRADYDLADANVGTRDFAMLCVERAHRMASAVNDYRQESVRESIRAAIAVYEQKVRPR